MSYTDPRRLSWDTSGVTSWISTLLSRGRSPRSVRWGMSVSALGPNPVRAHLYLPRHSADPDTSGPLSLRYWFGRQATGHATDVAFAAAFDVAPVRTELIVRHAAYGYRRPEPALSLPGSLALRLVLTGEPLTCSCTDRKSMALWSCYPNPCCSRPPPQWRITVPPSLDAVDELFRVLPADGGSAQMMSMLSEFSARRTLTHTRA